MLRATVSVLLVLTFGTSSGQTTGLYDLGTEPTLRATSPAPDVLEFDVQVGRLEFIDVETPAGIFTRIRIPGFHASLDVGRPAVPVMNRLLAVPDGATPIVEVLDVKTRRVTLAEAGIDHRLMPAQASLSKSEDPADVPFVFDATAYAEAITLAQGDLVSIESQGRLRAVDFARLSVRPIAYDPVAGALEIAESLRVRVRFDGGVLGSSADRRARTWSPFFEGLYDRFASPKGLHDSHPDHVRDEVTYVIVTPPEFEAQLDDFVAWKTERGFRVVVGVIGSVELGSTKESIQGWIHDLYHQATPVSPAPSFVLFVGDVAQCPTFTLSGNATDRPYCTVDADGVPDIYYGRFSATNTAQLQAMIDKTLVYDQLTMADPSYLSEVVLIAGVDGSFGPTHGNGTINYGSANYFNTAHGIDADVHLYPQSGSDSSLIVSEVSQGRGFVNYTAHGSTTSWADPSFTQSQVNSLQNIDQYGLVVGNACLTSTYDIGECFAETWLRAPDKGAVGYIGGSNSTYWDEDVYWSVGTTATISADIAFESTAFGAYDGLFHDHGETDALWYVTQDAVAFCGNLAVQESGSGLTGYYWDIYNLMGDPSLTVHLGEPAPNPVVLPDNLVSNQTSITVGAVEGSIVGVTQEGVLVGAGTVNAGQSEVTIDYLTSLVPGTPVRVVVTAQNRIPHVTDVAVASPSVVTITPDTVASMVPTMVVVEVLRNDGTTPMAGVEIRVEGPLETVATSTTDVLGRADFTIDYAFGTTLEVVGIDPVEGFLFSEPLAVTGAPLGEPDVGVATVFGQIDVMGMNLPSAITGSTTTPDALLVAIVPGLGRLESTTGIIECTPTAGGEAEVYLLVEGFEMYAETFPVTAFASVTGTVRLEGQSDMSGVTVRVDPDGIQSTTGSDGTYRLTGIEAGPVTVSAAKDGFALDSTVLDLAEGDHRIDVDFDLAIVYEITSCIEPGMSIPDDNVRGVTSMHQVDMTGEITWMRVHLQVTHTYQGDLRITLTSPLGTQITLHDRSGGSTDDIVGWYPDELDAAASLEAFVGEEMTGMWRLHVTDNAGADLGTLDSWCLNIGYAEPAVSTPQASVRLALERVAPNPFNPKTSIDFSLPQATKVSLAIYDLRGRRVATLIDGEVPAGRHRQVWDGRDDRGARLASGTYFCRLAAEGQSFAQKLTLLK